MAVRATVGGRADLVSLDAAPGAGPLGQDALRVDVGGPSSGVAIDATPSAVSLRVLDGTSFWQSSRPSGESTSFRATGREASPGLADGREATWRSGPFIVTDRAGRRVDLFSVGTGHELISAGDIQIRQSGAPVRTLVRDAGRRSMLMARPVRVAEGWLLTFISREPNRDAAVRMAIVDRDFRRVLARYFVVKSAGFNHQAYSVLRLDSGALVMPVVSTRTPLVSRGPWSVDIWTSTDEGRHWKPLGKPVTALGPRQAGIMEAQAVQTPDGLVAIVYRNSAGRVGRVDYDPVARAWARPPRLTSIVAPLAGLSAINLPGGSIAMAWSANLPDEHDIALPRKVVCVGVSSDGLNTFDSVYVVATASTLGDSLVSALPYVHQPRLSFARGHLYVGIDRVLSSKVVQGWVFEQSAPLTANVAYPDDGWVALPSEGKLDVLAAMGPATFDLAAEPER